MGISVYCSSGDNGAEIGRDGSAHVLAPASCEFAMACGATVLSNGTESAWEKTGGGFSERFAVPPWQTAIPSAAGRYGVQAGRGVPDVAAQQSPGYYVVMEGTELAMGGTSAIAPFWAALTARLNQRLGVPIGFVTPLLYAKANATPFNSVTQGNNGRYDAGEGWNPCTGLGTPNGTALESTLR
jgi:kumamolisin